MVGFIFNTNSGIVQYSYTLYTFDFFLCLQFLSSCVDGAFHVAEELQVEHTNESRSKEGTFQIVGTVSGKTDTKSSSSIEEYAVSKISA